MKRRRISGRLALCFGLVLLMLPLMTGCGAVDKMFAYIRPGGGASAESGTPESLSMTGLDEFNHGKYSAALKVFEDLKNRFPFSDFSLLAELKSADCHYYLQNYPEALVLYKEFEERHPTNEAIPYVIFQTGMCYNRQIETIDRDPAAASETIQAFSRLLRTAPASPYTEEARARILAARNFLANHEFYVATFYIRTKSYPEAEGRLEYLVREYPDASIAPQATTLLADLKAGNPPKGNWRSWLPEFSLPDWKSFVPTAAMGKPAPPK
ncbi:MAG: hypothetical protein A2521_15405 [Deltaproteobacteria bacterium RIFOXYD12_FULL_57_12]|nr:MAG: hypothetical protein A2521_15405 [Deltaproteobacteria bacterium RIFOXYD12_FULL_57_12]